MKKILFLIILISAISYSQNFPPSINGPSTSCLITQNYSTSPPSYNCYGYILSVSVSSGGTILNQSSNFFSVKWTTAGTKIIAVNYLYYTETEPGKCSSYPVTRSLTKVVNVQSSSIGNPSTVNKGLTNSYPRRYTFTTSATGASSYVWTVNNGTISGCSTCSTIQVIANSGACSISGSVRAKNNCGMLSPQARSFTRTISKASRPSAISGPTYVGAYGDYKLYQVSPSTTATSYKWYFAPGAQFLGQSLSNKISVFCTTNNTTASTLYVVAKSSCGLSSARTKTITGGLNPIYYKSADLTNGFKEVLKMTIVENPSRKGLITVLIPNYTEVTKLTMYNLSGQSIRSFTPTDIDTEIDVSDISKGIYILISESKNGVERKKFSIH